MSIRNIDPIRNNILLDTCAFDPKYSPEDKASRELFELSKNGKITLVLAHSNQKEISHPNTPSWVKQEAQRVIYTLPTPLIEEERNLKEKILSILTGAGKKKNMLEDADHIFEASKYGPFFVTTDKGILKRRDEIRNLCNVEILLPSQILNIINGYSR